MTDDVFIQLALVIAVASLVSIVMRLLKQPLIIGYILSGILVGPALLNLIKSHGAFDTFSEIGIALLLFIIGLELSITSIKKLGKPVFLTALAILGFVGGIGALASYALGFTSIEAIIIGLCLFFSSTIIIAKVLSDKKQLIRLNGQIAIGIVLFDDIIATFALLFVTAGSEQLSLWSIILLIIKGTISLGLLMVVGMKILTRLVKFTAKSQELLFIFALAWGFGIAALFEWIGFSIEIGALFAGVALAHLPYARQIGSKLKPLRDFFIILFFISLGETLHIDNMIAVITPVLILSAIVMILKPLIVMISLGTMRYTRRTSFLTSINISQISEFSIILAVLAMESGVVSESVGTTVTLIAIITIALSTYLMQYDNAIFNKLSPYLNLFERKSIQEPSKHIKTYPYILFGYQNGGSKFIKTFRSTKSDYLVVDHDPSVIDDLESRNITHLYGDAADPELLSEINFDKSKLIINAIADQSVNQILLPYIRKHNKNAIVICYANEHRHAKALYALGATFVMLPHTISSEHLADHIRSHGSNPASFDVFREHYIDSTEM